MTKEERAQWLEERKKGVGGTDAAKIIGVSRWGTELSVWLDKTGAAIDIDEDSFPMWWGRASEDNVARWFEKTTGKKVRRVNVDGGGLVWSKTHKYCFASIDRKVEGEDALLECKTAGDWKRGEWKDNEIPVEYLVQVYHELACTGYKKAYICAVLGNGTPIMREINITDMVKTTMEEDGLTVEREIPLSISIQQLEDRVNSWYAEHVVKAQIPTNISAADADTLCDIYPSAIPESVVDMSDLDEKAIAIEATQAEINSLNGSLKKMQNEIKAKIGDKEAAKGEHYIATWKVQATNGVWDKDGLEAKYPGAVEEFYKKGSSRVLKIREIKESKNEK